MLKIKMEISKNRLTLTANGHAGYAPAGCDIVCAAASMLVRTLMLSLYAQLSNESDIYFDDPGNGPLTIDAGPCDGDMEGAKMIFRTIACGLEALACQHPDNVSFTMIE